MLQAVDGCAVEMVIKKAVKYLADVREVATFALAFRGYGMRPCPVEAGAKKSPPEILPDGKFPLPLRSFPLKRRGEPEGDSTLK